MNDNRPHARYGRDQRCGAKTRAGASCKRLPGDMGRGGRCHLHGGKSLIWFAHPNFKHGRYSKYSITGIEARLERQRAAVARDFKRAVARAISQQPQRDITHAEARALLRAVHEQHRRRGWFVARKN